MKVEFNGVVDTVILLELNYTQRISVNLIRVALMTSFAQWNYPATFLSSSLPH